MAMLIFYPENHGTRLERVNPMVKLCYMLALSIVLSQTGGGLLFLEAAILTLLAYCQKIKLLGKIFKTFSIVFLAALIAVTEYLNSDIMQAASATVRFLSLFALAIIFTASTDTVLLSASLGNALSRVAGKKAYALSSDVMLVFALLPDIFLSSSEMLTARRARGGSFTAHPFRNLTEYTVSFLSRLFERAEIFASALEARYYDREARREAPAYRRSDAVLLSLLLPITGGLLWISRL